MRGVSCIVLIVSITLSFDSAFGQSEGAEVERYSDVLDCRDREPFEIPGMTINLDPDGIGAPISIETLVAALLSRDVDYKAEMLNFEVSPSVLEFLETEKRPEQVRVDFYLESSFAHAAKCALEHYQDGDRILPFTNRLSGRHEDGYVIERDGDFIVRVLTYQLVE